MQKITRIVMYVFYYLIFLFSIVILLLLFEEIFRNITNSGSLLYTFSLVIICGGLLYFMRQLYLVEKMLQKKTLLHYYMSLKYPIQVYKIPEDEGGGYSACIPQLGKSAFVGDGDSIEEALRNLEIMKEINFKSMIEKNIPIPLPQQEVEF